MHLSLSLPELYLYLLGGTISLYSVTICLPISALSFRTIAPSLFYRTIALSLSYRTIAPSLSFRTIFLYGLSYSHIQTKPVENSFRRNFLSVISLSLSLPSLSHYEDTHHRSNLKLLILILSKSLKKDF